MRKFIFIIAILVLFVGCGKDTSELKADLISEEFGLDTVSEATLARYQINEIKDYKGMRLDPSIGPRDNSISGVQYIDISLYGLTILGLVDSPRTFSYEEVLDFNAYEKVITLHCVEGWDATILWKGVKISDLLEAVEISDSAKTIIFKAVDGYTTSMPLSIIVSRDMILAYEANTNPLPPEMGYPFIVVAEDKLGYKWARWVNEIEISDDEDYEGYWEQKGFENAAEVSGTRKGSN